MIIARLTLILCILAFSAGCEKKTSPQSISGVYHSEKNPTITLILREDQTGSVLLSKESEYKPYDILESGEILLQDYLKLKILENSDPLTLENIDGDRFVRGKSDPNLFSVEALKQLLVGMWGSTVNSGAMTEYFLQDFDFENSAEQDFYLLSYTSIDHENKIYVESTSVMRWWITSSGFHESERGSPSSNDEKYNILSVEPNRIGMFYGSGIDYEPGMEFFLERDMAKPVIPSEYTKKIDARTEKMIMNNLKMLELAASLYFDETSSQSVKIEALIGEGNALKSFSSVDGESYPEIITNSDKVLTAILPTGAKVLHNITEF